MGKIIVLVFCVISLIGCVYMLISMGGIRKQLKKDTEEKIKRFEIFTKEMFDYYGKKETK